MSFLALRVIVVAPGTPQSISATSQPPLPTMQVGGITYPAGSATQTPGHIILQAFPGNTANTYLLIGNKNMNSAAGTGYSIALAPGASVTLSGAGGGIDLDDLWVDTLSTAANHEILLISLVG